jgi:hypothetical protein
METLQSNFIFLYCKTLYKILVIITPQKYMNMHIHSCNDTFNKKNLFPFQSHNLQENTLNIHGWIFQNFNTIYKFLIRINGLWPQMLHLFESPP